MLVRQAVLTPFLLLFLLFSIMPVTSIAEVPQPVYKAGDYFTYKVEVSVTYYGSTCTIDFILIINIVKIEMNTVTYNQTIKDVEKTGNGCPSNLQLPFYEGKRQNYINAEPIDAFSFMDIPNLPFFVDPSYSDEFRLSVPVPLYGTKHSASLKYSKGVLLSGSVNYDYGELSKASINIELIDSSVAEFKSLLQAQAITSAIIGALMLGVFIGIIVGLARYISRRRRSRSQPTPPQPQSPPAPQPAPSI
jgi:hypothetical protein